MSSISSKPFLRSGTPTATTTTKIRIDENSNPTNDFLQNVARGRSRSTTMLLEAVKIAFSIEASCWSSRSSISKIEGDCLSSNINNAFLPQITKAHHSGETQQLIDRNKSNPIPAPLLARKSNGNRPNPIHATNSRERTASLKIPYPLLRPSIHV